MNMLRQISHRSEFQRFARSLRLSDAFKEAYYRACAPSDRIFRTNLRGVEAKFRAPSAREWWGIESLFSRGTEIFLELLVATLHPGDVFFDIGSNIGEYAVVAAKLVGTGGKVVACEPVKTNYERLQEHLRLNNLNNVQAYRVALSDKLGKTRLELGGFLNRYSHLVEPTQGGYGDYEFVEVTTGDQLRESEGLPIPNAVKIDVEGYEYHVLKGMKQTLAHSSCRLLCCEVHPSGLPAPLTPERVVEAIKELGFTSVETVERGAEVHLICRKKESAHVPF